MAFAFLLFHVHFLFPVQGHSLAVDPWGKVLADAGGCDGPGTQLEETIVTPSIVVCDIEIEKLRTTRERMPIQQHREAARF
jgi:predicted amidohydrolase